MFSLTLAVANSTWSFLYKSAANASINAENINKALRALTATDFSPQTSIEITDDFEQTAIIRVSSLHGFVFEDLDKTQFAHIERSLHVQRMQLEGNRMAEADPKLRHAVMAARQGPQVLTPFSNGKFS